MPVWDENRGRQNCDGSRAHTADRLLIRPASGRQAGTGLSDRTNHWKDIHQTESFTNRVTNKEHRHQPDKRPRRDTDTLTVHECPLSSPPKRETPGPSTEARVRRVRAGARTRPGRNGPVTRRRARPRRASTPRSRRTAPASTSERATSWGRRMSAPRLPSSRLSRRRRPERRAASRHPRASYRLRRRRGCQRRRRRRRRAALVEEHVRQGKHARSRSLCSCRGAWLSPFGGKATRTPVLCGPCRTRFRGFEVARGGVGSRCRCPPVRTKVSRFRGEGVGRSRPSALDNPGSAVAC